MAFFIPENMTSSSTTSSNIPIKSHEHKEEEEDERLATRAVTRQLYLRSEPQRSLDKDVVLRRLRHRKRVNKLKNAFQSFIRVLPENKDAADDHHVHSWLTHDVFSSP